MLLEGLLLRRQRSWSYPEATFTSVVTVAVLLFVSYPSYQDLIVERGRKIKKRGHTSMHCLYPGRQRCASARPGSSDTAASTSLSASAAGAAIARAAKKRVRGMVKRILSLLRFEL